MNQDQWDELYPGGFRSSFSMRHMPKDLHTRARHVAVALEVTQEYIIVEAIAIGLKELELDVFNRR